MQINRCSTGHNFPERSEQVQDIVDTVCMLSGGFLVHVGVVISCNKTAIIQYLAPLLCIPVHLCTTSIFPFIREPKTSFLCTRLHHQVSPFWKFQQKLKNDHLVKVEFMLAAVKGQIKLK